MKKSLSSALAALVVFLVLIPEAQAYQLHDVLKTRYVGFAYSKLPADVKNLGGMVVQSSDSKEYAVSWVEYTDKKTGKKLQMLWLEQITHRVKGVAHYKVLAVQNIPPYRDQEVLAMGNCRSGDVSRGGDGRTIALVKQENKRILKKVRTAWRADPEHARFILPDAKRVQCLNEGGEE